MSAIPNQGVDWPYGKPGSDTAQTFGCLCPVVDNARGKGRGCNGEKYGWIISSSCPLHGRSNLNG